MIITGLLILTGWMLELILIPFKLVSKIFISIPVIPQIIDWFVTSLKYFSGIVNLPELANVAIFYLTVLEAIILIKFLFWAIKLIPWLGKYVTNPFNKTKTSDDFWEKRSGATLKSPGRTISANEVQSWYKR